VSYRLLSFIFFLIGLLFASCNLDQRVEGSKEAVEKMKSMQIKRVTDSQVIEIVGDWGGRIVKQVQLQLENVLSISKGDFSQFCQLEEIPKLDSLEKLYGVKINLLGANDVKNTAFSAKEREVLDAYLYNEENKILQISNIQKLGDSVLIYDALIPTENVICQKCFADDVTHLAVWRIRFKKNEVIRKVNAKSLEKKRKS
jgi:hypothetical protein